MERIDDPGEHRQQEHGDELSVDIRRIERRAGALLALNDDMGHYTPHVWEDMDGQTVCLTCGAVKLEEIHE